MIVRIKNAYKQIIIKSRRMIARKSSEYSIIVNNCIGADISKKAGMRFNSPTVNLQILLGQYCDFLMKEKVSLKAIMRNNFRDING